MSEEMKNLLEETEAAETVAEEAATEEAVIEETAIEEAAAGEAVEEPEAEPAETMEDYKDELEASFKKLSEGDVMTGTVIAVTDDKVILDFRYYAEGIITRENLSNDPNFNMKEDILPGDEITATIIKMDDGEGNLVLSKKEANDILAWEKLQKLLEERTIVPVTISQIVNSGAVAYLEGIRGFIPVSRLDAQYVEDLEEWNGKTLEVTVITADAENNKLVLSGREAAREKLAAEKSKQIAKCEVGAVMEGTVDSLKPYGAFVNLENGLSGLLHISQISDKRIKHPGVVLKEGQTVQVRIISTSDNKISLSMKALADMDTQAEEVFDYEESGSASTGLAGLLKGFKF